MPAGSEQDDVHGVPRLHMPGDGSTATEDLVIGMGRQYEHAPRGGRHG